MVFQWFSGMFLTFRMVFLSYLAAILSLMQEKDAAFDLLDAITKSGALPLSRPGVSSRASE